MTTKQITDWRVICTGILVLAGLEAYALSQGFNGTGLKIVIGVIGLAIGVTIPNPLGKK